MSMVLCDSCGRLVDSDDDPEGFYIVPDKFICEGCRDVAEEAEYLAELNRGYEQDRI